MFHTKNNNGRILYTGNTSLDFEYISNTMVYWPRVERIQVRTKYPPTVKSLIQDAPNRNT